MLQKHTYQNITLSHNRLHIIIFDMPKYPVQSNDDADELDTRHDDDASEPPDIIDHIQDEPDYVV
jgi:hypothetical protein